MKNLRRKTGKMMWNPPNVPKSAVLDLYFMFSKCGPFFRFLVWARSPSARHEPNKWSVGAKRFQSAEISTCVTWFSKGRVSTHDHMRPQVLYVYMDFDRPENFANFKLFSISDVRTSLFLCKIVLERRKRWILRSEMAGNGPKWT